MNILLIYETYSGGTLAAADIVAKTLTSKGNAVTMKKASESQLTDFNAFDFIMMATPSWLERGQEGQPHENFLKLMESANTVSFTNKRFALFGLGDETYAHFGKGIDTLATFITTHGGTVITPPLKIDGFYFNQKENEQKLLAWIDQLPLA